ncbi:alpha-glucosidase [Actinomadura hibisca]|uniref:alpha-glucosidase n=1 Tax=Actinomadura hibisca TaxID=68565 RepID=UPI00083585A5|nr:alpha-glucosidase [Actinomadura hibisca]
MKIRYRLLAGVLLPVVVLPLTASTAQAGVLDTLSPGALTLAPKAAGTVSAGGFQVSVDRRDGRARLTVTASGRTVWAAAPGRAFAAAGLGRLSWQERTGMFTPGELVGWRLSDQRVERVARSGADVVVTGTLSGGPLKAPFTWRLSARSGGRAAVRLDVGKVTGPGVDRQPDVVALTSERGPGERFHGFGEQFAPFDLAGRRVPILVREQGIGRGRQPLTAMVNLASGQGGSWDTTYAPMPFYLTSARRGFELTGGRYSVFDLSQPGLVVAQTWAARQDAELYTGASPAQVLAAHTASTGAMRPLPAWTGDGAVLGLQGGTARVRKIVDDMAAAGTKISAVWLQDWSGQRTTSFGERLWWTWQLDRQRYPGWEGLVADLHRRGIKVLTYVNPFLVDPSGKPGGVPRNLFAEARDRGYLVAKPDGSPNLLDQSGFSAALVDFTNPAAREWYASTIATQVAGVGADGWMADFGEGLPFDAKLHSGDPADLHNRWPVEWADVNRRACELAGKSGCVYFMRSAYTGSPGKTPLFWAGDQLVDFDAQDGMASALRGMLSGGVSGMTLTHTDIGGYTGVDTPLGNYNRSAELLRRWSELAAFGVFFRTHEGNRPAKNAQVYDSPESRAAFAHTSRVYAALANYRGIVEKQAAQGIPALRHTWLVHPDSPAATADDQFFFGSSMLVAPVLKAGATSVQVHLPAGRWTNVFTGRTYGDAARAQQLTVPAPLGTPAAFVRDGDPQGTQIRTALHRAGLAPAP